MRRNPHPVQFFIDDEMKEFLKKMRDSEGPKWFSITMRDHIRELMAKDSEKKPDRVQEVLDGIEDRLRKRDKTKDKAREAEAKEKKKRAKKAKELLSRLSTAASDQDKIDLAVRAYKLGATLKDIKQLLSKEIYDKVRNITRRTRL